LPLFIYLPEYPVGFAAGMNGCPERSGRNTSPPWRGWFIFIGRQSPIKLAKSLKQAVNKSVEIKYQQLYRWR
jgi:hypothetical protein